VAASVRVRIRSRSARGTYRRNATLTHLPVLSISDFELGMLSGLWLPPEAAKISRSCYHEVASMGSPFLIRVLLGLIRLLSESRIRYHIWAWIVGALVGAEDVAAPDCPAS
jgi:hypothetical protein